MMLSQASKIYQRSKRIRPLTKKQREKIYASKTIVVDKKIGQKKFSPFNTVSRDTRDSYLLRVTNQPNTKTNYQISHSSVLPLNRRPTIDKAKFQRIIGDVRKQDFSIELSTISNSKCLRSQTISPESKLPLTIRDHQKWRKTFEHFDFTKQQSTKRLKLFPKLSIEQSTNTSFMKSLKQTIESNFNNYERFKFTTNRNKAHSFQSDFGHEYLKEIQEKDKAPEYDIMSNNQGYLRQAMGKPKGSVEFEKFRQIIATRLDRFDPEWHTQLEYQPKQTSLQKKLSFDNQTSRKPNDIHSKYSMRLSLEKITKIRPLQIGY